MMYLKARIKLFGLTIRNQISHRFAFIVLLMLCGSMGTIELAMKASLQSGFPIFIIYCVLMLFVIGCVLTHFISYLDWNEAGILSSKLKVKDKECNDLINQIDDILKQYNINSNSIILNFKEFTFIAGYFMPKPYPKYSMIGPASSRHMDLYPDPKQFKLFRCLNKHYRKQNIIPLKDFFCKITTKDDKIELEKLLFQLL